MIYWLYEHRHWFGDDQSVVVKLLNVFRYHTFRAGGAALTAFVLSLALGERVIRKLISLKIGQPVRSAEEVQKLFDYPQQRGFHAGRSRVRAEPGRS